MGKFDAKVKNGKVVLTKKAANSPTTPASSPPPKGDLKI